MALWRVAVSAVTQVTGALQGMSVGERLMRSGCLGWFCGTGTDYFSACFGEHIPLDSDLIILEFGKPHYASPLHRIFIHCQSPTFCTYNHLDIGSRFVCLCWIGCWVLVLILVAINDQR